MLNKALSSKIDLRYQPLRNLSSWVLAIQTSTESALTLAWVLPEVGFNKRILTTETQVVLLAQADVDLTYPT